jgi:hypothetical protein
VTAAGTNPIIGVGKIWTAPPPAAEENDRSVRKEPTTDR